MAYTAEQEKYIAGLSRGMYIYFNGNSKPYEVLKVYGYVDPDTGEERKAVQYRLGALDDPQAKISQADVNDIDIKRAPFIKGRAADKEAGGKRTGAGRFANFAWDLVKKGGSKLMADPGDYQNPGKSTTGAFKSVYDTSKQSWDKSEFKDRRY